MSSRTRNHAVCVEWCLQYANCKGGATFLVRSPKDGELLGLEWGMIPQVSNIIFPDQNSDLRCHYSKGSDTI